MTPIKDINGRILGFRKPDRDGGEMVLDRSGSVVGFYNARGDITTDRSGHALFSGNQAIRLLPVEESARQPVRARESSGSGNGLLSFLWRIFRSTL